MYWRKAKEVYKNGNRICYTGIFQHIFGCPSIPSKLAGNPESLAIGWLIAVSDSDYLAARRAKSKLSGLLCNCLISLIFPCHVNCHFLKYPKAERLNYHENLLNYFHKPYFLIPGFHFKLTSAIYIVRNSCEQGLSRETQEVVGCSINTTCTRAQIEACKCPCARCMLVLHPTPTYIYAGAQSPWSWPSHLVVLFLLSIRIDTLFALVLVTPL